MEIENFVVLKNGTKIGNNVFVDSYVRSSGDNRIGNNVTLRFGCTIAREVTVEDGVFVSPNVMTVYSKHTGEKVGGTVIGANSHIGTAAGIGPGVHAGSTPTPWVILSPKPRMTSSPEGDNRLSTMGSELDGAAVLSRFPRERYLIGNDCNRPLLGT